MDRKVVLGLSGGMDSATLCSYYLAHNYKVFPIQFEYGSKHNQYEREAARQFALYHNLQIKYINLDFIGDLFKSNLLKSGGDIPEGHYEQDNMSLTVVPARNIIFASIMAGYAWSVGANIIALGVHAGDHAIYADCRAAFIACMNSAIISGTDEKVRIEAPFQYYDKTQILKLGLSFAIPTPYLYTRTCYKDQPVSCGKCGSCSERLEAWHNIGLTDPIPYESWGDSFPAKGFVMNTTPKRKATK